jgi:hypothetical protein
LMQIMFALPSSLLETCLVTGKLTPLQVGKDCARNHQHSPYCWMQRSRLFCDNAQDCAM